VSQGRSLPPNKRLGQHFLVDGNILRKIIELACFRASDGVLEIGPGRGALTLPLAGKVSRLVAVEKDSRLVDMLREKLRASGIANVQLVSQDILTCDLDELLFPPSEKIQVIGNLPYNISSPVLEKLMSVRERLGRAVLMFQREVAERLTASPCSKGYGAMTLLIGYHTRPRCLLSVPRKAFYPVPKVDSMVVELDFEQPSPRRNVDEETFRNVVKGAFSHRRKTLLNSLRGSLLDRTPEELIQALKGGGIDPRRRAETLTMEEFLTLASILGVDNRETD